MAEIRADDSTEALLADAERVAVELGRSYVAPELRALSEPGAAKGSVTLSNQLAVKDHAFQLFGAASFCLLLGILVAHLALFGGAFFLSATGFGYLRKAKGKVTDGPPAEPAGPS